LMIVAAMILFLFGSGSRSSGWGVGLGLVKLGCFFAIALGFHTELALRRPMRQHLTSYYLWVSGGGILGGLLNALVAPVVFSDLWEYPLTLVVAAALLPCISGLRTRRVNLKLAAVILLAILAVGMYLLTAAIPNAPSIRIALLLVGALLCIRIPVKWAAVVLSAVALSIGWVHPVLHLYSGRTFFGTYKVNTAAQGKWRILIHGNTIHGLQRIVDSPRDRPPEAYYVPVRNALATVLPTNTAPKIAVVGLGTGTISCFGVAEKSTTFFEIDPLDEYIANRYFTFLSECPGRNSVILGDGRLTMAGADPHSFDAIVLDAFTSDAIPVHLLTAEAFQLYREKLKPDGIILVHITNRYVNLAPVIEESASRVGYSMLLLDDNQISHEDATRGRMPSRWAGMVPADLKPQFEAMGWKPFTGASVLWTDDRSSVFGIMRWEGLLGDTQVEKSGR
jgi:hypothetical protein